MGVSTPDPLSQMRRQSSKEISDLLSVQLGLQFRNLGFKFQTLVLYTNKAGG